MRPSWRCGTGSLLIGGHGGTTWSYLWRKFIPNLVEAGHRIVAPDLIGAGRSDKPTDPLDYTYSAHVAWITSLIELLDLNEITLVCHDWGGNIGLRIVAAQPERFARVLACNANLPKASIPASEADRMRALRDELPLVHPAEIAPLMASAKEGAPPGFLYFQKFMAEYSDLRPSTTIGNEQALSPATIAAYDAPHLDPRSVAGLRRYPWMMPQFEDDPETALNREAWARLVRFEKPFLTVFAEDDEVMFRMRSPLVRKIAGAQGLDHPILRGAGHLVPETQPEVLRRIVLDFIARDV